MSDFISGDTLLLQKGLKMTKNKKETKNKAKCIYRFQDADKFDGQLYCTFFDELCKDLDFICPNNCQVFEYEKKLKKIQSGLQQLTNTALKAAKIIEKINEVLNEK